MTIENIKKGILKNLAIKNPYTLEVDKSIEGNSYFGVCIFVGICRMFDFSIKVITSHLSEDEEAVVFMEEKFRSILHEFFNSDSPTATTKAFATKTNLILNHIKLNYGKVLPLSEIINSEIK